MRDVEQRSLAGGLVVRDRGLVEVPEIVELVAVVAFEFPALRGPTRDAGARDRSCAPCRGSRPAPARPRSSRSGRRRTRRASDRADAQRVRRAFDHLVEVGVVERDTPAASCSSTARRGAPSPRERSCRRGRSQLALLEGGRDRHLPVGLDPRRPEDVVQVDGRERHRLDRVVMARGDRRLQPARLGGRGEQRHDEGSSKHRAPRDLTWSAAATSVPTSRVPRSSALPWRAAALEAPGGGFPRTAVAIGNDAVAAAGWYHRKGAQLRVGLREAGTSSSGAPSGRSYRTRVLRFAFLTTHRG